MTDPRYDIYFRGEILPDHNEDQVKAAIAQLFKASDAKLVQLFSGKVNAIKKSVDKATAAKYQQIFKKAGAKAVITVAKEEERREEVENKETANQETGSKEIKSEEGSWDVLPSGSDLLKPDEKREIPDVDIDTSAIKMASPFLDFEDVEKNVPPAPDTSHITVAPVGEDMNPDRPAPVPDLELDLSELSVAEVGATLVDKKEKNVPPAPDTSHIKLV